MCVCVCCGCKTTILLKETRNCVYVSLKLWTLKRASGRQGTLEVWPQASDNTAHISGTA